MSAAISYSRPMPPATAPIRVALLEDDPSFQSEVVELVRAAADMALVACAGTKAEGLSILKRDAPADVLLVDLTLPDGTGYDVIPAALAAWPHCQVMVCTALGDEVHVMKAIEVGASGYLLKDIGPDNILDEIRSLHAGGSPISPLIARRILVQFRNTISPAPPKPVAAEPAQLSGRECEVLELITRGFTAQEIAAMLGVSHHTVLTYVRRIYDKLKVRSKAEAIYEAKQRGILAP